MTEYITPEQKLEAYVAEWIDNGGIKWKAYHAVHGCEESTAKSNSSAYHKKNQEKITVLLRAAVGDMGALIPKTLSQILKNGGDTAKMKALDMIKEFGLGVDKTTRIELSGSAAKDLEIQQIDNELAQLLNKKKEE